MELEEFYSEHVEKVYRFFYYKSLNKQTAEDLTQDTWMRFIEKDARSIDDHKKYLYGVMRNVWLEFLKTKYAEIAESIEQCDDFEEYVIAENSPTTDDVSVRVQRYVELLPDKQRTVFELRFSEGMSVKDTATEIGKDKNYVKVTYKRALATLRGIIKEPYLHQERTNE